MDTAAELRGVCALGLVRMGYRDVLVELADLLMDPEAQARMMAARSLAHAMHHRSLHLWHRSRRSSPASFVSSHSVDPQSQKRSSRR